MPRGMNMLAWGLVARPAHLLHQHHGCTQAAGKGPSKPAIGTTLAKLQSDLLLTRAIDVAEAGHVLSGV